MWDAAYETTNHQVERRPGGTEHHRCHCRVLAARPLTHRSDYECSRIQDVVGSHTVSP